MLKTITMATMAATLALLVGCAGGRTAQERDALYVQNQELQEELSRSRAALDATEGDRGALLSEMDRLQQELAAARTAPPPESVAPIAANTGFEGIAGVDIEETSSAVTVRVPGDVLFASGKAELKSSARSTLSQIAEVVQREYPTQTIRVEGYTDSDPIQKSEWTDNLELSLARAAAVERYLQEQGVEEDRMYAAGFGAANPRPTKAQSRRVEIVVVRE